ncbi:PilZ domain-containing protein [Bdellovibrio reynosensis]|uniref:PilZ domain-containing protein n=1 Tax=Bdellovibrio reynosensis TaxID=2835041 RepID=A0ABY4CB59_9BACT|nr:PilZ domain-containing protein [Bdellovibrio reynosensis]UOF02014.1 PilZ domain-containing protein [Bdellovibrio reynosensis]
MAHPKIWFILSEGQTTGPFDQDEIEARLGSAKDPQIWGRGQSEWMTPSKWRQALNDVGMKVSNAEPPGLWRIRVEGQELPPRKYSELIAHLKTLSDYSFVDISPDEKTPWKEVYSVPRVVEDLGISRRSHPRVPIVGTLACEGPKGSFSCRVISISEGGIGINDARNLQIGERFEGTLTSPNLFITIPATCEVVYVGGDGYAGLRFINLPTEYKSSVIEYVNKFATT